MPSHDHDWLPEFMNRVDQLCRDPGYGSVTVEIQAGQVIAVGGAFRVVRKKPIDSDRAVAVK